MIRFHIFSNLSYSHHIGSPIINEWTGCDVAMENVVLIFLHLKWFGLCSYGDISLKTAYAFQNEIQILCFVQCLTPTHVAHNAKTVIKCFVQCLTPTHVAHNAKTVIKCFVDTGEDYGRNFLVGLASHFNFVSNIYEQYLFYNSHYFLVCSIKINQKIGLWLFLF